MEAYLFDTNIWSKWFREDSSVTEKTAQIDKASKIFLSCVVWGEVIYGANEDKKFDLVSYKDFIYNSKPIILPIDKNVADIYGKLRADLAKKYLRKGKHPEQWVDPATATEIGIDENDLWIVAQAVAYNLKLVTNDKMRRIFTVTPKELKYEIWQ